MSTRYPDDFGRPAWNPDAEAFDDDATIAVDRASLSAVWHSPPSSPRAAAPVRQAEPQWFLAVGGVQTGPFTKADVAAKIAANSLAPDTLAWREGLSDWEEIGWIPELRPATSPKSTIVPPPPDESNRAPETLSPLEKLAVAPQRLPLSAAPRLNFTAWHAMAAAVVFGVGVSFVALKWVGADGATDAAGTDLPPGAKAAGEGALEAERIRAAIAPYLEQTREDCWRQAAKTREPGAPPDVSLQVSIQIDTAGHVLEARSLGNPKGYPGLGECVAARTRGWSLPSAASPTNITLAFVFKKD